ncbi:MAG: hypothetical protein ACT4PU_07355 [Planctomycetota bacterium]
MKPQDSLDSDGTGDDPLWDRRGEHDPELAALEAELGRHRWTGRLPAAPLPARRKWPRLPPLGVALAAGLLALLLGGLWWWAQGGAAPPAAPPGELDGPVYLASALSGEFTRSELRDGERLVTDERTRVRIEIGDIGALLLEPESALRVGRPSPELAADAEHLLWLERGTLTASIFAAPRLFQLGTPGGLAVDLGCVYTAQVQDDGSTRLSVLSGQVSFETPLRRVTVPSGASTRSAPMSGPATPTWDSAPEAWRAAVARLDEAVLRGSADALERDQASHAARSQALAQALAEVLATERETDSLTLWHLLAWSALPEQERASVCDALQRLAPAPDGLDREALVQSQDREALLAWRASFDWSW